MKYTKKQIDRHRGKLKRYFIQRGEIRNKRRSEYNWKDET